MNVEAWLANLKQFPWWDKPTQWLSDAFESAWFIKNPDEDGSFLVETKYDTYEVFPPLSYQQNDSYYEESWWVQSGTQVQVSQLGKWEYIYGLRGERLADPKSIEAQELWPLMEGGWAATPRDTQTSHSISQFFGFRKAALLAGSKKAPKSFREYLARSIGVSDSALWFFASELSSFNLGFTFTPVGGKIATFEMSNLEVSTDPAVEVFEKFQPSDDLRKVGVGITSYSWAVSGTGGSKPLADDRFQDILRAINTPITTPKGLIDALQLVTREFNQKTLGSRKARKWAIVEVFRYLMSDSATEHFKQLEAAGFAVALMPMGGRTLWRP